MADGATMSAPALAWLTATLPRVVALESLSLTALEVCVAMAIASGSRGLEAAVVLTAADETPDLTAAREFAGTDVVVHVGDHRGTLGATLRT